MKGEDIVKIKLLEECEKCNSKDFIEAGDKKKFYLCQVCGQTYNKEEHRLPVNVACNHCGDLEFRKIEKVTLGSDDNKVIEKNNKVCYFCNRCGQEAI